MEQYQTYLANSSNQTSRFAGFVNKAKGALKGFGAALGSMTVNWAIGEVIGLVIETFSSLEKKEERAAENAKSMTSSLQEFHDSFSNGSKSIDELSAKYNELSKGVSNMGANISLTDEQYTEYKNTVSELSELMPNLNVLFNEQGEKIGFSTKKIKDASKEYQNYIKQQSRNYLREGDKDGNEYQDILDDFKFDNEENTYGWSNIWRDSIGTIVKFGSLYGLVSSGAKGNVNLGSEIFGAEAEYSTKEQIELLQKLVNTSKDSWSDILDDSSMGDSKEANLVEELLGIDVDEVSDMYDDEYSQIQKILSQKITALQQTLNGKANQITSGMQNMLLGDDAYWNIEDEELRNALSTTISGLNYDVLTNLGIDLSDQNIVETWVGNFVDDISSNKAGISDAIKNLFKLNVEDLNPEEAKKLVDKYIEIIAKSLYNGSATKEQKDALKKSYGFESVDSNAKDFQNKLTTYFNEKKFVEGNYYDSDGNVRYGKIEAYDKNRTRDLNDWSSKNNVTTEELEQLKEKGYSAKSSIEDLTYALNAFRGNNTDGTKAFSKAWDSIGTTGDDDTKKTAQETKEKLLELAEAGKLTVKAFEDSLIAEQFMKDTGLSAEEATKKINKLVEDSKQLASLKSGISSIQNAYQEKKENKVVSSDTFAGMEETFGKLKSWEKYKEVLGTMSSSLSECRNVQNKLATEYVSSNNFLSQLTDKNKDYYISQLKNIGIANAESIVNKTASANKEVLKNKTEALAAVTSDLSGKTNNASEEFLKQANMSNLAKVQLADLIAKEQIFNGQSLITSGNVQELNKLAQAYFGVANAIQISSAMGADPRYYNDPKDYYKSIQKQWNSFIKKQNKLSLGDIKVSPSTKSGNGSKNSKNKNTKQQIDWISRSLDRLSSKLDLVKSKYDNLVNSKNIKTSDDLLKARNKNLDQQYKILKKTEQYQSKAEKKYTKKANTVKLSSSLKKAVREGRISGSMKKLIASYGEKTANKIQKYQDYYDKAQNAKKSLVETQKKAHETKIEKQTNRKDMADNKTAQYQAEREVSVLSKKNDWINKELSSTTDSYNAQIEIAKLEKDSITIAKLRAEKQKAINNLRQEEIDNVKELYDAQIKLLETGEYNSNGELVRKGEQHYKNEVDLLESRGAIVSSDFYTRQNDIEREKIQKYDEERYKLSKKLQNVTEGTTEWYNLQSDIADCDNSIVDAKKAINENSSSIRGLKDAIDEKISELLNSLSDELDFIAGLQYDDETDSDTGAFTDTGNLHAITEGLKIAFGEAGADKFGEELKTLEKLYSSNASIKQWEEAGFSGYFNDDGTINTKAVDEKIKSLRDEVQSYINMQINGEKALIELGKQKYEAQKNYLQDIIEAKKEALNIEKDLYEYEKNIADKTKSVANLQKQIIALQGDDSEEGRARLAKLQVSLDDAQKDLQDSEYERYISDQQNMLDNLMTEYEDLITNLMKDTDKILLDMYDYIQSNESSLGNLFVQSSEKYGYATSQDLVDIVNALKGTNFVINKNVAKDNEKGIEEVISHKIVQKSNEEQPSTAPNSTNNSDYSAAVSNDKEEQAKKQQAQEAERNRKAEIINRALIPMKSGDGSSQYWTKSSGTPSSYTNRCIFETSFNGKKILNEKGARALANTLRGEKGFKFKDGENLTKKSKNKIFAALNDYFKASSFATGGIVDYKPIGEDGLIWARNGEGFVRPEDVPPVKEFVKIAPNLNELMQPLIDIQKIPDIIPNRQISSTSIGDVQFSFTLPNVIDTNSLISQIQSSQRVQRSLQEVTIGRANGNGKLSVNRIR